MDNNLNVIILAAGQGTRMGSDLPKVLHKVGNKPLLGHVVETANGLGAKAIFVVYGHGGERVKQELPGPNIQWIEQAEQLGTGHAVDQAMPLVPENECALILYGDVPLITQSTLEKLVEQVGDGCLALLTATLVDPSGYGRVVRDTTGKVQCIVEEKDANAQQRDVKEINTGMLAVNSDLLRGWLSGLDNQNVQKEYYLTDIIAMAVADGIQINTLSAASLEETEGINNKLQLAAIERAYQWRQAEALMQKGVTFRDPARFDLRGELTVGRDVVIDVNVVIEGRVELGDRVYIGPNSILRDSTLGNDAQVDANCIIEQSRLGNACTIGPFARLRPGNELSDDVKVGNFVEMKKSIIGQGSKVNHLSYVGDTLMGERVNVGAGTITCNYDGAFKHRTVIGDDAFIGSDTQLVAPVEIGAGATIGAGSTITRDAPPEELTFSRAQQTTKQGWKRPKKT
jgi:bifunctional UDP-N-acetylglucosamine pyrophosphorylase/glucosamine-1-phosphate N-acetyltransferase